LPPKKFTVLNFESVILFKLLTLFLKNPKNYDLKSKIKLILYYNIDPEDKYLFKFS